MYSRQLVRHCPGDYWVLVSCLAQEKHPPQMYIQRGSVSMGMAGTHLQVIILNVSMLCTTICLPHVQRWKLHIINYVCKTLW